MGEPLLARMVREAGERAGDMDRAGAAFIAEWSRELGRTPTAEEMGALARNWRYVARPEQLSPAGTWNTWLVLAGRGFGKTRTGAEWVKERVETGASRRMALIGPTAADVRDVMVEGESGLLAVYADRPLRDRPRYFPSKRRVVWPNGAIATTYSAEKPDRLRGQQHDGFWGDELAAWSTAVSKKQRASNVVRVGRPPAWDQLMFGLRLGQDPRGVVTTTPRPVAIIRDLLQDARDGRGVVLTKGTTYDNQGNLAPAFFSAIIRAYEGTRIGKQELNADVLDDNPNALWQPELIDKLRISWGIFQKKVEVVRSVVAVDPAVTNNPDSDLTGIVGGCVGVCNALPTCHGELHGFVMRDASGIYSPAAWARRAVGVYQELEADRLVGEVNNGGDLVETNVRANGGEPNIPYKAVRASRGKQTRAEPVAGLYEQLKVHHVGPPLDKLEDEMTQWDPISGVQSPSRMDAAVWLLSELMLGGGDATYESWGSVAPRRA